MKIREEIGIFFATWQRRVHYKIGHLLYRLIQPILWENDAWIAPAIENLENQISTLEGLVMELRIDLDNREQECE
jgi:hypothetical protein